MFTSKTGKGKILKSQTREVISRVMEFMKKEAEEGVNIPITNFRERIVAATGIAKATYESIERENKMVKSGEKTSFTTPKTAKPQAQVTQIDENLEHTIRNMFYDFHVVEKKRPTMPGNIIVILKKKISDRSVMLIL
jgi:polyhydroxyalkanoate synthesis regulator phasin